MNNRISKYGVLRNAISVSIICLLAATHSNGWGAVDKHSEPINVGMLALLAAPQKYDGKVIRTIGYLYLRSDGDALFFREEDLQIPLLKDSFAMELTPEQKQEFKALNLTYVMVEGTLRSQGPDGPAVNSGTISHITMVHGWKPFIPFEPSKK